MKSFYRMSSVLLGLVGKVFESLNHAEKVFIYGALALRIAPAFGEKFKLLIGCFKCAIQNILKQLGYTPV